MPHPPPSEAAWRRETAVAVLGVALAYVTAANLGRLVAYDLVTAVWPPTGVALAALLLGGLRLWPGVALGVFVTVGMDIQPAPLPILLPPGAVLAMVAGNTIEAVLGAWLLQRYVGIDGPFDRAREVVGLVLYSAFLGAPISATAGTAALYAVGAVPAPALADSWFEWWVGNVLGALVVTPVLTAWLGGARGRFAPASAIELFFLLAGLGLVATHALLGVTPFAEPEHEIYLLFPFLLWGALRFGPGVAATLVFVVGAVALTANALHVGTFAALSEGNPVVRVQLCVGVITVSILLLAATVEERHRACAALSALEDALRQQVADRTQDLEAANDQLRLTNAHLAVANRDLESFAWTVAHDLRAPLRAVSGFASVLREEHGDTLGPDGTALLVRVTNAATQMGRLIDGLLEVTRLGRRVPAFQHADMERIARTAASNLRGEGLPRVLVGELPPCNGDPALLERVFASLLENAVKYSRGQPGALVEIGGRTRGTEVEYWVRDNGVGFDMRYVGHLFRTFHRLHGPEYAGIGVGLAIVRRIVELHGGRVWAEGTEGKGATFHFQLPRRAVLRLGGPTT